MSKIYSCFRSWCLFGQSGQLATIANNFREFQPQNQVRLLQKDQGLIFARRVQHHRYFWLGQNNNIPVPETHNRPLTRGIEIRMNEQKQNLIIDKDKLVVRKKIIIPSSLTDQPSFKLYRDFKKKQFDKYKKTSRGYFK